MIIKGQLLSTSNLNNAYISKTDTNAQTINSHLIVSGGQITLKNSVFTDNASTSYLRIDPQGNNVIIYDGVNNQKFDVYSSSGSESTYIQTINGTNSFGQIDVSSAVDHLEINTNTSKRVDFGGQVRVLNGMDLILRAGSSPNDAGDIVFQTSGGTELARIYSSSGGVLNLSTGTNADPQISLTDSNANIYTTMVVTGKITANGGIGITGNNWLSFDTYGGGFNMSDTTWIRTTGNKSLYLGSGTLRTDGSLQVGASTQFNFDTTNGLNLFSSKFIISSSGAISSVGPLQITTSANGSGKGIKLDSVTIDSVGSDGSIALGGLKQLRFGDSTSWSWNVWGGIKFDSTNLKMYIGGPASAQFSANASPPTIDVAFTGIGKLGVGYDAPTKTLDVNGDMRANGNIYGGASFLGFLTDAGGALPVKAGSVSITSSYSNDAPANGLYVQGSVGVGVTSPSYKLDVSGEIRATSGMYANASNSAGLYVGDDSALWDINTANTMGLYGQQNTSVGAIKLGSTGPVLYGTGNMLGIGTTTPQYRLHVNGSIGLSAGGGIFSDYNSNHILKDFNNGNVTLSAVGGDLYLGYQNTTGVRVSTALKGSNGTTPIADTDGTLYYKGNDIDARYVNTSGDTMTSRLEVASSVSGSVYNQSAIQIREFNLAGSTDTVRAVAPRLTFHWSGKVASQIALESDGTIAVIDNPGTGYEKFRAGATIVSGLTVNGNINGQYGLIAKSVDEWLRINDDGSHSSGTYFGSTLVRTDSEIQVGANGAFFKANTTGTTIGKPLLVSSNSYGRTISIGDGRWYAGGSTSGDAIYANSGLHIGASGNTTLWSETSDIKLITGTSGSYTDRIVVKNSGDVLVNNSYVSVYDSTVAPQSGVGWFSPTTSGWYTIAYNGTTTTPGTNSGGDRAYAVFTVADTSPSNHQLIHFTAGVAYNKIEGVNLKLLGKAMFNSAEIIGGVRILTGSGTYDTQFLEVYLVSGSNNKIVMESNNWVSGWKLYSTPTLRSSIPANYTDNKLEMQSGYEGIPRNVTSGTSTPPSSGMFKGDIYIQY